MYLPQFANGIILSHVIFNNLKCLNTLDNSMATHLVAIQSPSYSSVIRQEGESQNGGYKKIKLAKFSKKFFTHWYSHMRVRIRGYQIFAVRKVLRALFYRNTRFEIRPFASLSTYSIIFYAVIVIKNMKGH